MIVAVPGDKSISQRALILAALSEGTSRVSGLLGSADPRATAGALRALGANVPVLPRDGSSISIVGTGLRGLRCPDAPIDLENSGTGARLLLGVLAGQSFDTVVTGDESLRSRPMRRVTEPLTAMGARFEELGNPGRLPIRVLGSALGPLHLDLPVASAQVKSALLLAGLVGGAPVTLTEPGFSRDHTERMFRAAGIPVETSAGGPGRRVEMLVPPERLTAHDWNVPGDFSSAAFWIALGLLGNAGPKLTVRDVGLNPSRTGLLTILARMGARVSVDPLSEDAGVGEPVGTVDVLPSELTATTVEAEEVPAAIDELPILAALATRAQGVTRIVGAGELRVKETDRLRALAENFRALGVSVNELEDGLEIEGSDAPMIGRIQSYGDHRIAMAFGVLGSLPGCHVEVDGAEVVDVSYPEFWGDLRRIAVGGRS
jgi:3-phosphoshikimate 1-carboxyvinyltransferase